MTNMLDKFAEEVVTQAVHKLVQTVADNVNLIRGIDSEIIHLTSDIETFNARLADASLNPRANEFQLLEIVLKKFRTVIDEAQDAVAKYITLKKKHEQNCLTKYLDKNPLPCCCGKVKAYASEIQFIRTMMNTIRQDHEIDLRSLTNYLNHDDHTHIQDVPVVKGDYVMGFEGDLKIIKGRLIGESNYFIVIPIMGIPGIGKTTFAKQIFEEPNIRDKFTHCIWVNVSQGFNRKQKFIDILNQITEHAVNFSEIYEDTLEQKIKDVLAYKKYLVVLDNVWGEKDWDLLKTAFPKNSKGSRILLTTRHRNVAESIGEPHVLKELSTEVGWLLLQKIIFGEEECKNALLKDCGVKIVKKCNALPLALVMIGGILRKSGRVVDWKQVAKNPFLEINRNDQSYHQLVMLSYDYLPHQKLKNCFLYFAYFPLGHEVGAWKLIRLWIAEQFIPSEDEWGRTLDVEDEAQKYLTHLVDRNLVIVTKRRADGQIKTCRIHDTLHEFCRNEATRKNLFHVMDERQRLDENSSILPRRLCLQSSIITDRLFVAKKNPSRMFFSCYKQKRSSGLSGQHVHSLLLSSTKKRETEKQLEKGEIHLTENQLATIPDNFPLLRVLDIESTKFKSLPDEIFGLELLRHLAISADLAVLPKQFDNLRDLETLVFKTTERKLDIGCGIWNMEKLRHVVTNTSAKLPTPPKNSIEMTYMSTLSTISPSSCKEKIFRKTPNLQKLGVRGNLAELLEENQGMSLFHNLQKLDCLENLKLHGQSDKVLKVPTSDKFPKRLRKLTLSNTLFEWDDMSILGSLEMLEVLKLDENAFTGERWNLNKHDVFKQLRYLRIGRTNLATWKVKRNNFPILESLVLRNCTYLREVPSAFGQVLSLKVMELFHASQRASTSAREIHKQRHGRQDVNTKGFELFITSLPLQEKEHKQTQGSEDVNTHGFGFPITSIPLYAEDMVVEESNVAGFDDEVRNIKDRLIGGSKNLTSISIVGIRGIGKTTLATMIYKDRELEYEFFIRLWVDVSESFDRKKIFLNILSMLITDKVEEYDGMVEKDLAEKIRKLLHGWKYFIVIDDIRMEHDWERLKNVFPDNMNGSRVLMTTRNSQVASLADSVHMPLELKGKTFYEDGMLAETARLIYDKLDSGLKDCFLYFAAFPEDLTIDARKLMRLWIAEGLVQASEGELELERIAEKYLNAFVEKRLLIASKRRANGQIKTVTIHNPLLAFCKDEATKQNLLRTLDRRLEEVSNSTMGYRRLSVHSSVLKDTAEIIKSSPSSEHVQSFLSFPSGAIEIIPEAVMAAIPNAFPNLKVLDIGFLIFHHLPKDLYRLHHIRYLAISTDLNYLPKEFGNLSELQVLIFHTTQSGLKIEADIWNMPKLRHLYTNTPAQLPSPIGRSKSSSRSACITTLSTISPTSCTGKILDKATNLQKLRIRGNLGELMEYKGGISSFDNLRKLPHLENLKLLNSAILGQPGRLQSIPQHDKFPQKLRKLTLSNTSLEWDNICVLAKLDELEVLKLDEYAFKGQYWELDEEIVFKKLRFLRIGRTDLVSWEISSSSSFPMLETLAIRHCTCLSKVPSDFTSIFTLILLELYCTNKMVAISAREIREEQFGLGYEDLELSIFPPDH